MRFRRRCSASIPAFLLAFAGVAALFSVAAVPASAQSDIYTVRGVPVDQTAGTAAEARQAAISAGHQAAFARLVDRLVPKAQQGSVPVLGPGLVEFYVLDFSVNNERTSAVRYLAELNFRFNPQEVRTLFRNSGVGFAETRSKPLVVLPVFGAEGEAPRLWREPNPWRGAWAQRGPDEGLVPVRVPLGDLSDVASVDAASALAGDATALGAIAANYGASAVLVAHATLRGDPALGGARLDIVTSRYEQGRRLTTTRDAVTQQDGEAGAGFFARAAGGVDAAVQEAWKQQNVLQFGNRRSIAVFVPLTGLSDWLQVKQRLGGVAAIQAVDVNTLTRNEAKMEISFVGDEGRLTRALAQRDLFLSLREDSNWELTLTGRPAGGAGSAQPPASGQPPGSDPLPPPETQ